MVSASASGQPADIKPEMTPSEARGPPVPGHQISEAEAHGKETLAQLLVDCSSKFSSLKPMLQFTLPRVGASLGANSLMSLLSLDWVNRELDLGLDYEDLWESELTNENISIFLNSCMEHFGDESVTLTDIEDIVDTEIFQIGSLNDGQVLGRVRFEQIVNQVLESDASKGWISQNESKIKHILASGPSEELLKSCRRRDEEIQQHRPHRKDAETITTWFTKVIGSLNLPLKYTG